MITAMTTIARLPRFVATLTRKGQATTRSRGRVLTDATERRLVNQKYNAHGLF